MGPTVVLAQRMASTHIFDCAPRPVASPVAQLAELWLAHCSCGWRAPFEALRVDDAREDWREHAASVGGVVDIRGVGQSAHAR